MTRSTAMSRLDSFAAVTPRSKVTIGVRPQDKFRLYFPGAFLGVVSILLVLLKPVFVQAYGEAIFTSVTTDCLNGFLAVVGLCYTLIFSQQLQYVIQKFTAVETAIRREADCLSTLIDVFRSIQNNSTVSDFDFESVYRITTNLAVMCMFETLPTARQPQYLEKFDYFYVKSSVSKSGLLDKIHQLSAHPDMNNAAQTNALRQLWNTYSEFSTCHSERRALSVLKQPVIQWVLNAVLMFVVFWGVLWLDTSSMAFNLTICTMVSCVCIFAALIVADYDDVYNGTTTVSNEPLWDLMEQIEEEVDPVNNVDEQNNVKVED